MTAPSPRTNNSCQAHRPQFSAQATAAAGTSVTASYSRSNNSRGRGASATAPASRTTTAARLAGASAAASSSRSNDLSSSFVAVKSSQLLPSGVRTTALWNAKFSRQSSMIVADCQDTLTASSVQHHRPRRAAPSSAGQRGRYTCTRCNWQWGVGSVIVQHQSSHNFGHTLRFSDNRNQHHHQHLCFF